MVAIDWDESYRIILSRYPYKSIYDRIADPQDISLIVELEQRTNDRVRDEIGDLSLVRVEDRISGPGTTPVMAAFTHARASRFSDGRFGVYYAARVRETAIAETTYHIAEFYRATAEPSADIDMRVYVARIRGQFEDLRSAGAADPRLDPLSYVSSQPFGLQLYEQNAVDGIVYLSVRDQAHQECVACFRPKNISDCQTHSYLTYRWDGTRGAIVDIFRRESLAGGDTPPTRA